MDDLGVFAAFQRLAQLGLGIHAHLPGAQLQHVQVAGAVPVGGGGVVIQPVAPGGQIFRQLTFRRIDR